MGYREVLLELSKDEELFSGKFGDFIKTLLFKISTITQVERASFWFYDKNDESISCYLLYENSLHKYSSGSVLSKKDYPAYFNSIEENLVISASDAISNPSTKEFANGYLNSLGISSMLDGQVRYHGNILGLICLEHVGKRRIWNAEEEYITSMAANYISISYTSMLRKQAEEKIIESEKYFRLLFEQNPSPMWVYNIETLQFISVNNAAIRQYGYPLEQFLSMSLMDIRSEENKLILAERIKEIRKTESTFYQTKHLTKEGKEIDVEIHSNSIIFKNQRARIVLATDISNRKLIEVEKEKLIDNLSDYAFFTSHHLRAPVARILGLTDILMKGWFENGKAGEVIEKVRFSTQELDEVIRELNKRLDGGLKSGEF